MLNHINPADILFLDIETVPQAANFDDLNEQHQNLWQKKAKYLLRENETAKDIYQRAGIYAEFGKIICISVGYFNNNSSQKQFRITSFFDDNEKFLLEKFLLLLTKHFNKKENLLCAHNGKEFDFPFIARRMLVHDIILPQMLSVFGKKPWEINHLDTMELWRFGDYKSFTSLELLAHTFSIPTPKDDINGSDVWWVYWKEKDFNRIVNYCQKDVLTIAQIFLKYKGAPLIEEQNVVIV